MPRSNTVVANLNASGSGSSRIANENSALMWVVIQISVLTNPTISGCTCRLTPPAGIIDTSYFAGTGDVAGDEPVFLFSADFIDLTWTNGPANGVGIATYVYYELAY